MVINKNTGKDKLKTSENLPERVLQFGTGVLLRGLCDDIIDRANKRGKFNGRIVVVKTTGSDVSEFTQQDGLYTILETGIKEGKVVENYSLNEAISRVISSETDWQSVVETAENKEINIVISNTTEAGLVYVQEVFGPGASVSFPGKLCQWLHHRYSTCQAETVVIPTELIVDNGALLHKYVLQLATDNGFEAGFYDWLKTKVHFCSSLVDRIVPGKPAKEELERHWKKLGYVDHLLIKAEPYTLWAIEGEGLEHLLGFVTNGQDTVILKPNIEKYRELKLRLLNAPHTLMCSVGVFSGFRLVREAMANEGFVKYMHNMMLTELAPAIPSENIDEKVKQRYIMQVLDRFRNESIDHLWQNICVQYTLKMRSRVVPLVVQYYKMQGSIPHYMVRCLASYLFYMKCEQATDSLYYGEHEGQKYLVNCDYAAYFSTLWAENSDMETLVSKCFSNTDLWGQNLSDLTGLDEHVSSHLSNIRLMGVPDALASLNVFA